MMGLLLALSRLCQSAEISDTSAAPEIKYYPSLTQTTIKLSNVIPKKLPKKYPGVSKKITVVVQPYVTCYFEILRTRNGHKTLAKS